MLLLFCILGFTVSTFMLGFFLGYRYGYLDGKKVLVSEPYYNKIWRRGYNSAMNEMSMTSERED